MPPDDQEGEVDDDVGAVNELLDGDPIKDVTAEVLGFGQAELAWVERTSAHGHDRADALGALEGPQEGAADVARRPCDRDPQPGHPAEPGLPGRTTRACSPDSTTRGATGCNSSPDAYLSGS